MSNGKKVSKNLGGAFDPRCASPQFYDVAADDVHLGQWTRLDSCLLDCPRHNISTSIFFIRTSKVDDLSLC